MKERVDPAVLHILGEALSALDSPLRRLLLRADSPHALAPENTLLSTSAVLPKAEKHLLAVYREEVAYLLEQAAQETILRMPMSRAMVYRSFPEPAEKRIRSNGWWQQRRAALRTSPASSEARQALALFEGADCVSASKWIGLSLELVPNDRRRIVLGVSLSSEGDEASAAAVLEGVLSHEPDGNVRSYCLQTLAWTLFESKQFVESAGHYRRSFELSPQRLSPLLAWLHAAFCSENRALIEPAARAASEVNSEALEGAVGDHTDLWRSRIESGGFRPSLSLQRFVQAVRGDLPDEVRRITDVFAHR